MLLLNIILISKNKNKQKPTINSTTKMSYTTSQKFETSQEFTVAKKATAEPTLSTQVELFNAPLVEKLNSERAVYSEHSTSGSSSCQVS